MTLRSATPMSSVLMRESFPDTQNPGYFLIKAALWLLAAGMLIEGMLELFRPPNKRLPRVAASAAQKRLSLLPNAL